MAVSILPGAVKQLLAASAWNEYNIVMYESESGEIIVCNDLELLQVINLSTRSVKCKIRASLNSDTGSIAIATGECLVLYEAIESFGRLPSWELAFHATDVPASSVSWLNRNNIVATTAENDCLVWNVPELRISWTEKLTSPHASENEIMVESIPAASNAFATHDFSPLVKLWKQKGSQYDFDYLTHTANVSLCCFVSPDILATMASGTLFLWRVAARSLIASIPLSNNVQRPFLVAQDPECILVQTASRTVWQLKVNGDGTLDSSEWSTHINCNVNDYTAIFATTRRIYSLATDAKSIDLYELLPQPVKIGTLTGILYGGETCLSSWRNTVLAGKTVLRRGQAPKAIPYEHEIIMNCLTKDAVFVVTKDLTLNCYKNHIQLWKVGLETQPLALDGHEAWVVLVFTNKFIILDAEIGSLLLERNIEADAASIWDSNLLVRFERYLRLWNFSASNAIQVAEREVGDENTIITDIELGPGKIVAVLQAETSILSAWTASDSLKDLASLDLGNVDILCMKWSQKGDFFAILTSQKVLLFAITRTETIVQVGEGDIYGLRPNSLAWTEDLGIVLFNGQQIIYRGPELDEVGHSVLLDRGISNNQASIIDLQSAINTDMPFYHPKVILIFVVALRTSFACFILEKLWKDLKFADITAEGIALLDPALGLSAAALNAANAIEATPTWPVEEFRDRLVKSRPLHLTKNDVKLLQELVSTLGDSQKTQCLDGYAMAYHCLLLLGDDAVSQARVYAWFSKTKPELLNSVGSNDSNLAFWLERDVLADITEQQAKARFAKEREPTTVTLPYVALQKMSVLMTLWRISSGHPEREKTLKFLSNDFTNERWRLASQKNAYALLSKHRPEYAAAFFLLGDSVIDCCQVLVNKIKNVELAVAVARLYDGDSGKGMQMVNERCFGNNSWLRFWCSNLANGHDRKVLDQFAPITTSNPELLFVYVDQGGQFDEELKILWKKELHNRGFSELACTILIDPLQPKVTPAITTEDQNTTPIEANSKDSISHMENNENKNAHEVESRPLPSHLKPAPTELQLEPDMSVFGF